jgi:Nif-specific regulatory protein
MIGTSDVIRTVYDYIDTASRSNITVLITGESGVGKELVAKAIHYRSSRAEKSFIKVHCADLSESVIEGTLFGQEKGASAGATALRKGSFESADRGTIFLDEIGELAPVQQAKLLEFLKKREFKRIGGDKTIKVDVRVIAATSHNLEARMREGKFSKDIFYQLNIFPIVVPPLRERKTDIIVLADYFIEKFSKELKKTITSISPSALDMLMHHHWPGNVQELENCIERAVILSKDSMIHQHHLPPSLQGSLSRSG